MIGPNRRRPPCPPSTASGQKRTSTHRGSCTLFLLLEEKSRERPQKGNEITGAQASSTGSRRSQQACGRRLRTQQQADSVGNNNLTARSASLLPIHRRLRPLAADNVSRSWTNQLVDYDARGGLRHAAASRDRRLHSTFFIPLCGPSRLFSSSRSPKEKDCHAGTPCCVRPLTLATSPGHRYQLGVRPARVCGRAIHLA
jgi:hypothetical protein